MTQHLHHPFGTLPILLLGLSLSGWAEAQSDGIVDGKNFLIWQDGLHGTSGLHVAIGSQEFLELATLNRCSEPVELDAEVTPYPPDGVDSPDFDPFVVAFSLGPGELKIEQIDLSPSADGVAHTDLRLFKSRSGHLLLNSACFAPGQGLIVAAAAIRSSTDGSLRRIFQGSNRLGASVGDPDLASGDPVAGIALLPVKAEETLQLAASNRRSQTTSVELQLFFPGGDDDEVLLAEEAELQPGALQVISLYVDPLKAPTGDGHGYSWGYVLLPYIEEPNLYDATPWSADVLRTDGGTTWFPMLIPAIQSARGPAR